MKTPRNLMWRGISPLMILLMTVSCAEKDGPETFPRGVGEEDLSEIRVKSYPPPLFADLPDGSGRSETKGFQNTVPLGSVLDMAREKHSVFKGSSMVQIPFSGEYSGMMAYFGKEPGGDPGEASVMKRFLIVSGGDMFVVTMAAGYEYARTHPGFDYLDKPDYTGAVVFSTVSGELIKVQSYGSGRIVPAEFVASPGKGDAYIIVYEGDYDTRSSDGTDRDVAGRFVLTFNSERDGSPWLWDPDGSSGGGDPQTLEKYYSVSLSSDIPDEVEMTGGGTYTAGSTVIIGYREKYSVKVHTLDHWTGDLAWCVSARFSRKLTGDLESTAYFDTPKPCSNRSKGVTNPLIAMRIAASNVSMALSDADDRIYANYYGGTFGLTRTDREGNPRRHEGLDLYAEVGTPVYAAYNGKIVKAVSGYGDQHVENSYGNELRITTTKDRKTFIVQYAHLRGGSPFAVNPRTGRTYREGDIVYQGDLIGYSGRSGNATNVPNPHLHLGVQSGGKWIDPKPYINGTYASGQKAIDRAKGRITDVRCD